MDLEKYKSIAEGLIFHERKHICKAVAYCKCQFKFTE